MMRGILSGMLWWCALLLSARVARAEMVVMMDSESRAKTRALAFDAGSSGRVWLVSLPGKRQIGQPFEAGSFIGLPSRSHAYWNTKRRLVAVTQGGIPYSETKLLRYSKQGLKELSLPDLEPIADRWFRFGPADEEKAEGKRRRRTYVTARGWITKDKLLMMVSGEAIQGSGEQMRFWRYAIECFLRIDRHGHARVIEVTGGRLELL